MNSREIKTFFQKYRIVIAILMCGAVLRLLPIWLWGLEGCIRDECTYLRQGRYLWRGEGMVASAGWLWAPGYPSLIALHKWVFGSFVSIKYTQIVCSLWIAILIYRLSSTHKVGCWACALYMFHPTHIFFAQSLWSEVFYGLLLLLMISVLEKRVYGWKLAFVLACGILFRGAMLYLAIILFILLWKRASKRVIYRCMGLLCLMVLPYSIYASSKFERTIISDRSLGQMMWLGNNGYDPITFDWGNGVLSRRYLKKVLKDDQFDCPARPKNKEVETRNQWSMERADCQLTEGVSYIVKDPITFVARIPLRFAQLCNPHSFLTRHIRMGKWNGLGEWGDEVLIMLSALLSMGLMVCGTMGLVQRRKESRTKWSLIILVYHVCAVILLAGLSRYRVPLEPICIIFAGEYLFGRDTKPAPPKEKILMILTGGVILFFALWFFPSGWSWWKSW